MTEEFRRSRHSALTTFSRDDGTSFIGYAEEDKETSPPASTTGEAAATLGVRLDEDATCDANTHTAAPAITPTSTEMRNVRPPPTHEQIYTAVGHANEDVEPYNNLSDDERNFGTYRNHGRFRRGSGKTSPDTSHARITWD